MNAPRHITDDDINHFFIRAATHIDGEVYSIKSCLKNMSNWQSGAEEALRNVNALRAQILLVAQVLDGQDIDSFKLKEALADVTEIDKEMFEAALDAANIVRVQNEKVGGYLVVKGADMKPEDIDRLKTFIEDHGKAGNFIAIDEAGPDAELHARIRKLAATYEGGTVGAEILGLLKETA